MVPDDRPGKVETRRSQAPVASDDVGQGVHNKRHPQPPGPLVGGHNIGQVSEREEEDKEKAYMMPVESSFSEKHVQRTVLIPTFMSRNFSAAHS